MSTAKRRGCMIAGAALLVVGIVSFAFQVQSGVPANIAYPFGIYLALFFTLAGGGAGLVCLGAAARFGWLPALAGGDRKLYGGALALLVGAGVTIALLDCGHPGRVVSMVYSASPTSLVTWDFFLLVALTVLCVACLVARGVKAGCALAGIAAIVGLLVVSIEALILVVTSGLDYWNNPALVPVFVIDAIVIAVALALLSGLGDDRRMRIVLASCLIAIAFMSVVDIVQGVYSADPSAFIVAAGQLAPLYWLAVVACTILPAVLLLWKKVPAGGAKAAGGLALLGVFALKLTTILGGEAPLAAGSIYPNAMAVLANTQHSFLDLQYAPYVPEVYEIGCALGVIGLIILLYVGIAIALSPKAASRVDSQQA